MTPTATQQRLIELMKQGHTLMWFGSDGPELSGYPKWPQKRTVRTLIKAGVLKWGEYHNQTQRESGMIPVLLTNPT